MRTREEIRDRLKYLKQTDFFGMTLEDLQIYLPEEFAEGAQDSAKEPPSLNEVIKLIVEYLPFAFEKAINHRGLSTSRSIQHLVNWAWLACRNDLREFAEADEHYKMYGVPILKLFAQEFGVLMPPDIRDWQDGKSCQPDCQEGCSDAPGEVDPNELDDPDRIKS